MKEYEYDVRVAGEQLQAIQSVTAISDKYVTPGRYATSFESSRLRSKIYSTSSAELMLLPQQFGAIDVANDATAELTVMPELSYGRHQSRTGVQFGQLVVSAVNSEQIAELVAVKYMMPCHVSREFAAMQHVNEIFAGSESPASFTPLGFLRHDTKSDAIGFVTKYDHDVTTLDRVLWERERTISPDELTRAFGHAAVWLAQLHARGITHGDAQPKNIAYDRTGTPRYIDLEDATNHRTKHASVDTYHARIGMLDDIETFLVNRDGDYSQHVAEQFAPLYTRLIEELVPDSDLHIDEGVVLEIAAQKQNRVCRFADYTKIN